MSIEKLLELKNIPRIFIYSTGAGAGIQKILWEVPGCSSFLVGCEFPYDSDLTAKIIGHTPMQFVSEDTSIELAMAAYTKAYKFGKKCIGVGVTASVASTRMHKGSHRVVITTFSDDECLTFSTEIRKGSGKEQRKFDGNFIDQLAITAILKAAKINCDNDYNLHEFAVDRNNTDSDIVLYETYDTLDKAKELLLKQPYFNADPNGLNISNGCRWQDSLLNEQVNKNEIFIYPGSFNPLHFGHILGAKAIKKTIVEKFGELRDVVFTTTIDPVHKEGLSVAQMLARTTHLQGRPLCYTKGDALFIDKARRFPGAWFGLGSDTLLSMLDPKWGISNEELLEELQMLNIRMFIVGRLVNEKFIKFSDIENSNDSVKKYKHLFVEIPGRWDVSSTELRNNPLIVW